MGCLRVIAMAEIIPVEPDKVMLDWGMSFLAFRPFMRYSCRGVFICFPDREVKTVGFPFREYALPLKRERWRA